MQFNQTIQSMRLDEIQLVFSILSKRDLSQKVRDALMIRYKHGDSLHSAALKAKVSRQHVSNGEKRILKIHNMIMEHYGNY